MNNNSNIDELIESITDPITMCTFVNPYVIDCGHTFSKITIDIIVRSADQNEGVIECPTCCVSFDKTKIKLNRTLYESIPIILRLKSQNDNKEKPKEKNNDIIEKFTDFLQQNFNASLDFDASMDFKKQLKIGREKFKQICQCEILFEKIRADYFNSLNNIML